MSEMLSAGIIATGHYVPQKVLSNADLERMIDTSDEWIRTRTGIETRHISSDREDTSDLCVAAAKAAMEKAHLTPADIDLIMVGTASPDYVVPSTACIVQSKLGCACGAMDFSAGCTGYVYGLTLASQFIRTGLYKHVLVIGAETLSRLVDWSDRTTCILFGDGAGAAILAPVEEGYGYLASELGSDGSLGGILNIPASGVAEPVSHRAIDSGRIYIHMEGSEVFKHAVRHMEHTTQSVMEKAGITLDDVALFIAHQANYRIIHATAKKLGIDDNKVFVNVNKYGNTSAASIGIALDEAVEEGRLHKGDYLVLTGFGAGLTWGSVAFRWAVD